VTGTKGVYNTSVLVLITYLVNSLQEHLPNNDKKRNRILTAID